MKKDNLALLLIILTAIVVRVMFIWIGRPEFVGWFNHTYYYYVQVQGLLEKGTLPFSDMPLLFHIYASTAKLLIWFGIDIPTAIVTSTRFWMSIIPSLITIPVYLTLKSINHEKRLDKRLWTLIFASAFLPLSLMHIPELLQKNALGLFLLAVLIFLSKKVITTLKLKHTIPLILTFVLIILTHYGSAGVAILYILSIFIALLITKEKPKNILIYGGITIIIALVLSVAFIYYLDIQRYERILFYIEHSFNSSPLGLLFSTKTDSNQKIIELVTIIIPVLVVILFFRLYNRSKKSISKENRLFWLGNIIFSYLLILPIYDQQLFARLALFIYLPLLFTISFILIYSINKRLIKRGVLILIAFGTLSIAFGEFMNLKFRNRDIDKVYADLLAIKEKQNFHQNDLIITKYGAEHICIWFLETKSGVITSLNQKDFDNYENIYILNPIEGTLNYEGAENIEEINDSNKYSIMSMTIPKPKVAEIIYESEYIQILILDSVPEEWKFDDNGNWISFKK